MKRYKKPNRIVQITFFLLLLIPIILFVGRKYFIKDVDSATLSFVGTITSKGNTACGINSMGDAYCWGNNNYGQLGNGVTGTNVSSPVLVSQGERPAGVKFTDIDPGGDYFVCALGTDGEVYCWGRNSYGQLGNGTNGSGNDSSTPVKVLKGARQDGVTFKSISSGYQFACAVGSDDKGYCWGRNTEGQLGNDNMGVDSNTPVEVSPGARGPGVTFSSIVAAGATVCSLGSDNNGYCWGQNNYGQLGNGNTGTSSDVPDIVDKGVRPTGVTFTDINTGGHNSCGLGSNSQVYCWGWNTYGQLGNGLNNDSNTPVLVAQGDRTAGVTFKSIAVGGNFSCAIGSNDSGYCWGLNNYGQLGYGNAGTNYNVPKLVEQGERPSGVTFTSLTANPNLGCGVGSNGLGYCWGYNNVGQLGHGNTTDYNTPVLVVWGGPDSPKHLLADYGWNGTSIYLGWTAPSDYGTSPITDYIIQYSTNGGSTWTTYNDGVSSNTFVTVSGLTSNTTYTFRVAAVNGSGISTYSSTVQITPQVLGITSISPTSGLYLGGGDMVINATGLGDTKKFASVIAGGTVTCGLGISQNAYCWGLNDVGQLGNGTTINSDVPVVVSKGERPSGVTFHSVSTNGYHSCGLGSNSEGYCWGSNTYGQLGNNKKGTNSSTPVLVLPGDRQTGVTFHQIDVGNNHACGVGSNGEGYCWGQNNYGQLGNSNMGVDSSTPSLVSPGERSAGVKFVTISVSGNVSCGLGTDGNGYCWGQNNYGQLGNGVTGTDYDVPKLVVRGERPVGVKFRTISPGGGNSCGLGTDGNGYCWGSNSLGQLGKGSTGGTSNYPVLVVKGERPTGITFDSIDPGNDCACGVGSNGEGYCWGSNNVGQLGNNDIGVNSDAPVLVDQGVRPDGVTFSNINAGAISGYGHVCGIGSDGRTYCWGYNNAGQLGNGNTGTNSGAPSLTQFFINFDYEITVGNLEGDDVVITQSVPAGSSSITLSPIPAHKVGIASISLKNVTANVTSNSVSYTYNNLPTPSISSVSPSIISPSGGTNVSISGTSFLDYTPISGMTDVGPGGNHTCAVGNGGVGYCWGWNAYGQLGNGTDGSGTDSNIPVIVSQGERSAGVTFSNIEAGWEHSCSLGSDGEGYCWGKNDYGQLGNGNTGGIGNIPVKVLQGERGGGITFTKIAAGYYNACGLGSDNEIYCWGRNNSGQLGNGYNGLGTDSSTPVKVLRGARPANVTFKDVSVTYYHACGLGSDNEIYCWGYNEYGQLGNDGYYIDSNIPVQVAQGARITGVTFSSVRVGFNYSCGLGSDGEGYCWGRNNFGQLGNGSKIGSNVPVLVSKGAMGSSVTFSSISAGGGHSCGLGSDGNGYCWGRNDNNQLGNGSNIDSNVPVLVSKAAVPGGVSLSSIKAGGPTICLRTSDSKLYCSGSNSYGQLGNMETVNRPTLSYVIMKKSPTIEFGSTPATSTTYTSTTAMSAVSPILNAGTIAVKLTNPDGQYDTYNIFAGTMPSAPLNLVATYGDGKVSLGWSMPLGEVLTDYIIQYSNNGGSTWSTFNDGTSSNTFTTVTGLTNGTQYTFRVAAVNPVGTGPYSATVQSTPYALGVTSISPTSGVYLGGGSMTINATGLGDTHKFIQVSSGGNHTCGLSHDGNGYCWGRNDYGQLGNGNNIDSDVPVLVSKGAMGASITFSSISVGMEHTCGVGSDGNGYCWGYNYYGRLGNGGGGYNTYSNIPVKVSMGSGITLSSISAGYYHTCGVGSDGNGYCWGYNGFDQLGNGITGGSSNVPVKVSMGSGITLSSISAGGTLTCGIGSDGNGYCWGYNDYGQLGNGNTGGSSNVPVSVSMGSGITLSSISAGRFHTCGIGSNGNGYCWGRNDSGQLGNGNTGTDSDIPVSVSMGSGITLSSISASDTFTCGVGSNGKGYCWGWNIYGQLGNSSYTDSNIPVSVSMGSGITLSSISAGQYHTCGVGSDGNGYCWGYNAYGQLGNGSKIGSNVPVLSSGYQYAIIVGNNTIVQSVPGASTSITLNPIPAHTIGTVSLSLTRVVDNISSNSKSYTYTNLSGPDITSITPSIVSPSGGTNVSISGTSFLDYAPINNLTSVSTGGSHTCGIDSNGSGYCWGYNNYGQLGNGTDGSGTNSSIPVLISKGAMGASITFSSISAGGSHTCGIGSDGNGYCWGYNAYGQLGNGNTGGSSNVPVKVSMGSGITLSSISAGNRHTCGVGSDGNGYCWGYNYSGQLGNSNTGTDSDIPVKVSMGSGITLSSISAGSSHTCGVGSDGNGYCWGYNAYGQLGNSSYTDSNIPVSVSMGSGITLSSISAGQYHTCGVGSDGNGYCWGYNAYGQLGNGITGTSSNVPVLVSDGAMGSSVTFSNISAGIFNTCGIGSNGNGYCWGGNQLGDGSKIDSNVPVLVSKGVFGAGTSFTVIEARGTSHTCGLLSNNRSFCWGYNNYGQLGNMETVSRPTPSYVIMKKSPTIEFGSTPATSTTYTSTTAMSAVSPTLSVGTVAVKLTNPDGQYDTYDISVQGPPTVPLNLGATAGNTQVVLTWNVPSSDGGSSITDYIIQYSTDNSTWTTFNDGTSTNTTATVTGLTNRTLYYFRVAAVNNIGTGPYTSSVTATPVNPLPTVTNVTLNGGNAITLVEGNTKSVTLTAQVINDTGCTEITSVKGYLYRSGKGYTNCNDSEDADGNFCYPEIGCSVDTGSCTGSTDYTADYTCTVSVQYFADPTDTGTQYDSENWLATIKATNSGDLSTSTEITTGVEMNSLVAFSVTSTLNYGDLLVGGSNSPLDRILITTATGNVGLDQEHKGEEIGMCTDYPTCTVGTPIVLSHQKYSLTASTPYSTPTTAISLTNTSVEVELNLAKPTSTTAVSKNTWWGVFIPPGTLPGYYQGRNTITAVKGETTHW
ncbi:MAG: fibronectin type III domain-containing protein [Candidatus Dojkabacteria bacterium]